MKKVKVVFDVDGTLRCNCTDTCRDPNIRIVQLWRILQTFKNVELYVWSGGGADYAWEHARQYQLDAKESHCLSKIGAPHMDIAIDDQQEFNLATLNLIVHEK